MPRDSAVKPSATTVTPSTTTSPGYPCPRGDSGSSGLTSNDDGRRSATALGESDKRHSSWPAVQEVPLVRTASVFARVCVWGGGGSESHAIMYGVRNEMAARRVAECALLQLHMSFTHAFVDTLELIGALGIVRGAHRHTQLLASPANVSCASRTPIETLGDAESDTAA
jgi:hypothetical protein